MTNQNTIVSVKILKNDDGTYVVHVNGKPCRDCSGLTYEMALEIAKAILEYGFLKKEGEVYIAQRFSKAAHNTKADLRLKKIMENIARLHEDLMMSKCLGDRQGGGHGNSCQLSVQAVTSFF